MFYLKSRCIGSLLFGVVLTMAPIESSSKDEDAFQLRADEFDQRREGIKAEIRTPVDSDQILVLSAMAQLEPSNLKPPLTQISLGILTVDRTRLNVVIEHERSRYFVEPTRDEWGPGLSVFTWPTDIMQRHNIQAADLFVRAATFENNQRSLYPGVLYSGKPAGHVVAYSFVVAPLRDMALTWCIANAESEEIVISANPGNVEGNRPYYIEWLWRDPGSETPEEGVYSLKLEGTYQLPLVGRRTVSLTHLFRHNAEYGM